MQSGPARAAVFAACSDCVNLLTMSGGLEHNGIDALACYAMDIGPDTRMVANPARVTARKQVKTAETELVAAERALPQLLNGDGTPKQKNVALPRAHAQIRHAQTALDDAKTALKPIPAKVLATE